MKLTARRFIRRRPSAWSGILEKVERVMTPWFKTAGDLVVLLGRTREELGGSEYLKCIHGLTRGMPPWIDLRLERAVQLRCIEAIEQRTALFSARCFRWRFRGDAWPSVASAVPRSRLGARIETHEMHPGRRGAVQRIAVAHRGFSERAKPRALERARGRTQRSVAGDRHRRRYALGGSAVAAIGSGRAQIDLVAAG